MRAICNQKKILIDMGSESSFMKIGYKTRNLVTNTKVSTNSVLSINL